MGFLDGLDVEGLKVGAIEGLLVVGCVEGLGVGSGDG